jgi:16S rRNA (cytosine967-C5)-methyltransferase
MMTPRTLAFTALRSVREDDAFVNLLLPRLIKENALEPRDAALATELTHGTIRRQGTYDAIIDSLAARDVDPAVRDALRLGVHQVLSMRVPDHAALKTTGDLVRREIGHKPVGFVNALLRRISQKSLEQWIEVLSRDLDAVGALALRYSHPCWIVDELTAAVGEAEVEALLAADNEAPKVTLVARPGLADSSELPGTPGRWSPFAKVLDSGDPGAIAAVRQGRAAVQDEGSQLVALTLAQVSIEGHDTNWLDVCAGPGGKAALLGAIAAGRGASVVANEVQHHRADLVRQSVRALRNVSVTEFDGREGPWEEESFDRILLDAPCTGLGALRRRPEVRWASYPRSPHRTDRIANCAPASFA